MEKAIDLVEVPLAQIAEARLMMEVLGESCCGRDECACAKIDPITEALVAGYTRGVRHARQATAYQIRAELVCCSDEDIDAAHERLKAAGFGPEPPGFHHICYWAEMAARLVEDFHSMQANPYQCPGKHPGECWGPRGE